MEDEESHVDSFELKELPVVHHGGKHKDVFLTEKNGYVVLKSKQAVSDTRNEHNISFYTNSINKFSSDSNRINCISVQTKISKYDIASDPMLKKFLQENPNLQSKIYKFSLKNIHGIAYQEVHKYIKKTRSDPSLSIEAKEELAITLLGNVTQLMYNLFINKISNGDFHGNNMKISFTDQDDKDPKNIEGIEAFDWGHHTLGENFDPLQTARYALQNGGKYFSVGALKRWQQNIQSAIAYIKEFFGIDSSSLRTKIARRMVFADIFSMISNDPKVGYKNYLNSANIFNDTFNELERLTKRYKNFNDPEFCRESQIVFDELFAQCVMRIQSLKVEQKKNVFTAR